MAKTEYTDAVRAAAMTALLEGQSVSAVAKQYKIPKGTISDWKKKAISYAADGVASEPTQKRGEIGDLLLDYLRTMLCTLKVQAEHFGDKDWLREQGANELAVLHGVSTDKAIRLLEALSGAVENS
jgi:transposase-like protein